MAEGVTDRPLPTITTGDTITGDTISLPLVEVRDKPLVPKDFVDSNSCGVYFVGNKGIDFMRLTNCMETVMTYTYQPEGLYNPLPELVGITYRSVCCGSAVGALAHPRTRARAPRRSAKDATSGIRTGDITAPVRTLVHRATLFVFRKPIG